MPFSILSSNGTFRYLFAAQAVSLLGTGFATIALALLAFHIADENAGAVLGTALAIRIVAYIIGAPLGAVITSYLPCKPLLIGLDLIRAAVVCLFPFATEAWQIYCLVFVLQFCSASFTPAFQAVIPQVVTDERDYIKALSLSRVAADLEMMFSPILAALALGFFAFQSLFAMTFLGFALSAAILAMIALPPIASRVAGRGVFDAATRGIKIFAATPRLRGLIAIKLAVAAAGAMVLVNTIVLVQGGFGLSERHVAIAIAFFGCGSLVAALLIPRILDHMSDRRLMIAAALFLSAMLCLGAVASGFGALLVIWFAIGLGSGLVNTPGGRLLVRSSAPHDRSALFSAHFTLSHVCWLLTYPLAGHMVGHIDFAGTFVLLAGLALLASIWGAMLWPREDRDVLIHSHPDLPDDHPHLGSVQTVGKRHAHVFHVDEVHPRWPATS